MRLPSGAASGGAAGALGGFGGALGSLLTSRAFTGLALTGGAGLLLSSIGMGGGAKGALTGAAGGALIGTVIPGIGTLLGAGIGALVGLIAGLFGQHKGDKARIGIMEPLIAQIKIVRDSYDVFQTDYNTGISELEKLRSDALAGLRQIGGRQVSGNTRSTNKLVDDAESYLKTTQAERARRGQIAFGAPQFHEGGFVHPSLASAMPSYFRSNALAFATGGEVPAILHSGEFVMNQSAVRRVGRDSLDRMNAGGGGGDVHHHWNVTAMDAKSFESWLKDGAGVSVLKFLRYADSVGMA